MRFNIAFLLLVVLGLVAVGAACSSHAAQSSASTPASLAASGATASATPVKVRPAESIFTSAPTTADLTAHSARVLVNTTEGVVCAVSYGTSTAYGRIATDSDMAGHAQIQHHPLLTGLVPNTLYHYRFNAVDAQGALFRSRDYTFKTPPASTSTATRPSGPNLALLSQGAAVVGVSSNYGGGGNNGTWGADHALDGNPNTAWSSNGDGTHAWIEIALAHRTHVTTIGFWTRTMGNTGQILSFKVATGSSQVYGPFKLKSATAIQDFPVNLTAKDLKFEAASTTGGNTGAIEIAVYGQPAS